ncbi:MAG: hypothetical protein ABIR58_05445, partial [Gemmatimonadaceae bacterium]
NETILGDLPWSFWLRFLMLALAFLMISNVSYPAVPTIGYRKLNEILGSLTVVAVILGVILLKKQFYFPALVAYVLYGVGKTVLFGMIGRRPRGDVPVISDDDEDLDPEPPEIVVPDIGPAEQLQLQQQRRKRRRRPPPRGDRPSSPRAFPPTPPEDSEQ